MAHIRPSVLEINSDPPVVIRTLTSLEEYRQAEVVQQQIWNMTSPVEVVPLPLLLTAQKNGGLVLGAFDEEQMVAMLFGFVGIDESGQTKHCSHMMGVVPKYRGRGIGFTLKVHQRNYVAAQGLSRVTWTYDPLEMTNARLNLSRLGAVCRTYHRDAYGELRDALNQGLPTDRFQVDWWVNSRRVAERLRRLRETRTGDQHWMAGERQANRVEQRHDGLPVPAGWSAIEDTRIVVEVPADIQEIKRRDLPLAHEWRRVTRAIFEHYFQAGYAAIEAGLATNGARRRGLYLLTLDQDFTVQ